MSKLLFRKDYLNAIETCQYSWSSIGIRNFVDDFLKEYSAYNQDIISTLMEYILAVYPTVEKQRGLEHLHKKNYSNINEEVVGRKLPQLQILYSYLIFLSEKELVLQSIKDSLKSDYVKEDDKTTKSKTQTVVHDAIAHNEDERAFQSDLSEDQLSDICETLISFELIAPIERSDFISIFKGTPFSNLKNRIVWIATYQQGQSDNVLLLIVLSTIIDSSAFYLPSFFNKLKFLFSLRNSIKSLRKTRNEGIWHSPQKRRNILQIQKAIKASLSQ
jgi:hypothetical protein